MVNLRNQGLKHGGRITRGRNQIRVHNVDVGGRVECNAHHAVLVVRMIFAKPAKRNRPSAQIMALVNVIFNAFAERVVFILQGNVVSVAERGIGRRNVHVTAGIINVAYHFLAFFNEQQARLGHNLGVGIHAD